VSRSAVRTHEFLQRRQNKGQFVFLGSFSSPHRINLLLLGQRACVPGGFLAALILVRRAHVFGCAAARSSFQYVSKVHRFMVSWLGISRSALIRRQINFLSCKPGLTASACLSFAAGIRPHLRLVFVCTRLFLDRGAHQCWLCFSILGCVWNGCR
jgi:hypothetical protein